jgi:lysozyme family protein
MAVNMGGGRAIKILQEACNSKNAKKIDVDGGIGPATIRAASNVEPFRLRAYRVMFYAELVMKKPSQERFWVGWFKRSCEV